MTTITRSAARLGAALIVALAALAIAPPSGASLTSRPPKLGGGHMHWYHWHPSTRSLQARAEQFGSTAMLGLESMDDLASVRATYGFDQVRVLPALKAAEVRVDEAQLRAPLAQAPSDPRIRYVSPRGRKRRVLSTPNDPMLHTIEARTNLPYEWSFGASHVDRALDFSKGNAGIVVGVIDTGVADIPDLAGKVDSRWTAVGTTISEAPAEGHDDFGHGTGVASLIAANVDDGFGMAGFGGATHVIAVRAGHHGFFFEAADAVALTKLVSLGVRIVNMSIGGETLSEPILVDAIHLAAANGVLLIASAGNFSGSITWPARDLQPSRRRTQLRAGRRRNERGRTTCELLGLGTAPFRHGARRLPRLAFRSAGRAARRERVRGDGLPDLGR